MALLPATSRCFVERAFKIGTTVWRGFATMSTEPKVSRTLKSIGTHNGTFHCDEALAVFMLCQLPDYHDAEIKRTRDTDVLNTCDIVVDVGGIYNPNTNRFDHHQRDFNETLSTIVPHIKNKYIRLSSAGLVYAHYGLQVIHEILKKNNVEANTDCLQAVFLAVYEGFVEELDAIDNGEVMYPGGTPRYRIGTHLSARVHNLNPKWNSPEGDMDKLFRKAMDLVGGEFTEKLVDAATVWWPAREIVKRSMKTRLITHSSGSIVELAQFCPWKNHLLQLEEDLGMIGDIKFVIFKDTNGAWRVQCVPNDPDSFVCRVFLQKDWRGLRDEKLSEVAGIPACTFCHATGFIGGNQTRDGAIHMAVSSLKAKEFENEVN